jgi:superfamily I DNA/RNA helicase
VVVTTCQGVKGREFDVVICFGLLTGYIPHWSDIYDGAVDADSEAEKILYVVASRARRFLHLFSEAGRSTRTGRPYDTTRELQRLRYDYDA